MTVPPEWSFVKRVIFATTPPGPPRVARQRRKLRKIAGHFFGLCLAIFSAGQRRKKRDLALISSAIRTTLELRTSTGREDWPGKLNPEGHSRRRGCRNSRSAARREKSSPPMCGRQHSKGGGEIIYRGVAPEIVEPSLEDRGQGRKGGEAPAAYARLSALGGQLLPDRPRLTANGMGRRRRKRGERKRAIYLISTICRPQCFLFFSTPRLDRLPT